MTPSQRKVFKYALDPHLTDHPDGDWLEAEVELPDGAGLYMTRVDYQFGRLCLWTDVVPGEPVRPYRFAIVPTGGTVPEDVWSIGTVLMNEGTFVWHVFGLL